MRRGSKRVNLEPNTKKSNTKIIRFDRPSFITNNESEEEDKLLEEELDTVNKAENWDFDFKLALSDLNSAGPFFESMPFMNFETDEHFQGWKTIFTTFISPFSNQYQAYVKNELKLRNSKQNECSPPKKDLPSLSNLHKLFVRPQELNIQTPLPSTETKDAKQHFLQNPLTPNGGLPGLRNQKNSIKTGSTPSARSIFSYCLAKQPAEKKPQVSAPFYKKSILHTLGTKKRTKLWICNENEEMKEINPEKIAVTKRILKILTLLKDPVIRKNLFLSPMNFENSQILQFFFKNKQRLSKILAFKREFSEKQFRKMPPEIRKILLESYNEYLASLRNIQFHVQNNEGRRMSAPSSVLMYQSKKKIIGGGKAKIFRGKSCSCLSCGGKTYRKIQQKLNLYSLPKSNRILIGDDLIEEKKRINNILGNPLVLAIKYLFMGKIPCWTDLKCKKKYPETEDSKLYQKAQIERPRISIAPTVEKPNKSNIVDTISSASESSSDNESSDQSKSQISTQRDQNSPKKKELETSFSRNANDLNVVKSAVSVPTTPRGTIKSPTSLMAQASQPGTTLALPTANPSGELDTSQVSTTRSPRTKMNRMPRKSFLVSYLKSRGTKPSKMKSSSEKLPSNDFPFRRSSVSVQYKVFNLFENFLFNATDKRDKEKDRETPTERRGSKFGKSPGRINDERKSSFVLAKTPEKNTGARFAFALAISQAKKKKEENEKNERGKKNNENSEKKVPEKKELSPRSKQKQFEKMYSVSPFQSPKFDNLQPLRLNKHGSACSIDAFSNPSVTTRVQTANEFIGCKPGHLAHLSIGGGFPQTARHHRRQISCTSLRSPNSLLNRIFSLSKIPKPPMTPFLQNIQNTPANIRMLEKFNRVNGKQGFSRVKIITPKESEMKSGSSKKSKRENFQSYSLKNLKSKKLINDSLQRRLPAEEKPIPIKLEENEDQNNAASKNEDNSLSLKFIRSIASSKELEPLNKPKKRKSKKKKKKFLERVIIGGKQDVLRLKICRSANPSPVGKKNLNK